MEANSELEAGFNKAMQRGGTLFTELGVPAGLVKAFYGMAFVEGQLTQIKSDMRKVLPTRTDELIASGIWE